MLSFPKQEPYNLYLMNRLRFHHLCLFTGLLISFFIVSAVLHRGDQKSTPPAQAATPFSAAIQLDEPLENWKKFQTPNSNYTLRYPSTWDLKKETIEGHSQISFFAPAAISDIPVFAVSITEFRGSSGTRLRKAHIKEASQAIFPPGREQPLSAGKHEALLIPEFLSTDNLFISLALLETESASYSFRSERPLTEPSRPEIFESFIRNFELTSDYSASDSIVE